MHTSVPRTPYATSVLVEVAERRGVTADLSLRGTGLTVESLSAATEVTREQEVKVIANVLDHVESPLGIGAEVGLQYHLTTFGVWGFALLSSPTVGSAIATGVQFLDLAFALSKISLRVVGDEARLTIDGLHHKNPIRHFVVERDGFAMRTFGMELTGNMLPLRRVVTAMRGDQQQADILSDMVGAEVVLNAPVTYAAFDRRLLDLPVPQGDPARAAAAVAQCEELLASMRKRIGYAGAVRSALLAGPNRWGDIASVAATVHLSERTLQRRLIEEGTSFRELVAEVREGLAVELLATGMPVFEVARRLGYVEVSSFSQAFHRWRGVGPSAYRAKATPTAWGDPDS